MQLLKSFRSLAKVAGNVMLAALPLSCGGGGGGGYGGGSNGGNNGGGAGGTTTLQPTFQSIQDNVFTPICTACHTGAGAPHGLRLDAADSYALLVGVASDEVPSLQRVKPSDPANSYLIQKLEGTAAVGGRMPLNGTPLSQADIAMIRQWITDGAQGPPAPAPSAPVRVTTLTPLPDSTLSQLPASITVGFDRELNATTVDATTFIVERSGGDGTFGDGNEVAVTAASITVPASNPKSAVFDMTGAPQVEDTYRVRLLGAGAAVILDLAGNALDGEYAGSLPSGNGTAGGDFSAQFVVASQQATLASLQANVFTPICSACHTGTASTLPGSMDLTSAAASFASLVNVASLEVPALKRVTPNDADASYLIQKLEGTAAVGGRMPLFMTPLDAATLAAVRQWIANGAPQ
jgi:cytochrome c5